jgi:hypothetical protein
MSTPPKELTKTSYRRFLNDRYGMNYLPFTELKPHMKKKPYGDYIYAHNKGLFDMFFQAAWQDTHPGTPWVSHKD